MKKQAWGLSPNPKWKNSSMITMVVLSFSVFIKIATLAIVSPCTNYALIIVIIVVSTIIS